MSTTARKTVNRHLIGTLFGAALLGFVAPSYSADLVSGDDLVDSRQSLSLTGLAASNSEFQNLAAVKQRGMFNQAAVTQSGDGNLVQLNQDGAQNIVEITQAGLGNQVLIAQVGTGNQALINQQGNDNLVDILQQGDHNLVNVNQFGNQSFTVQQIGDNGEITITQY